MADLVVPAGTTLTIDANFTIAPKYGLFRMEANSIIRTLVDVTLIADQAEFEQGCVIDGRGTDGASGTGGNAAPVGSGMAGSSGRDGFAGHRGSHITISAALGKIGGLSVITDGGLGGPGGAGGAGADEQVPGSGAGIGGPGGRGGVGGRAGQITMDWIRVAAGLPREMDVPPVGHHYQSNGGPGGMGGPGGIGGRMVFGGIQSGGPAGGAGAPGLGNTPHVRWRADLGSLLWAQAQDIGPAARSGHAMVFDQGRGKLVLFGGNGDELFGDTWEWDGHLWTQVADTGPAPRTLHGMAYDPNSRCVLVFGGTGVLPSEARQVHLNDTWGWDGTSWIQLADTGPSPRIAPAMGCDPKRQRVVLFSGGTQPLDQMHPDTWEWNGTTWTQVADTGPSARLNSCMAYDAKGAVLLLFGGDASPADTWAWDGQHWRQVADTGPSARQNYGMAPFDEAVILFGGQGLAAADAALNDTWAWTGESWRMIQDMGPGARHGHAMATVGVSGKETVTVFGGRGAADLQDTWQLAERA